MGSRKYKQTITDNKRYEIYLKYKEMCAVCKVKVPYWHHTVNETLQVHHIDMDSENNGSDNLILLCRTCHKTLHREKIRKEYMKSVKKYKIKLIKDLIKQEYIKVGKEQEKTL